MRTTTEQQDHKAEKREEEQEQITILAKAGSFQKFALSPPLSRTFQLRKKAFLSIL